MIARMPELSLSETSARLKAEKRVDFLLRQDALGAALGRLKETGRHRSWPPIAQLHRSGRLTGSVGRRRHRLQLSARLRARRPIRLRVVLLDLIVATLAHSVSEAASWS